jgi:hypothetical protein
LSVEPEEGLEPVSLPSPPGPRLRRTYPGSDILIGTGPRDVLQRVSEGDPLGLVPRCRAELFDRAFLIDMERLCSRAFAQVAFDSMLYGGDPPLDEWLRRRIQKAIEGLLNEDCEIERASGLQDGDDDRHVALADLLGLRVDDARRACIAFNDLPDGVRSTYFRTVIEGQAIEEVARGLGVATERVREDLKRALLTIAREDGTKSKKEGTDG